MLHFDWLSSGIHAYHDRPVSLWLRYIGIPETGRTRAFPFTLIAKGDSNHVQPFSIQISETELLIGCNSGGDSIQFSFPVATYNFNYWSKMTLTYSTNGVESRNKIYMNGTLLESWNGYGKFLRFHESSTLVLGEELLNCESYHRCIVLN